MSTVLDVSEEKVFAVTKKSSEIATGIKRPLLNISAEWLLFPADAKRFTENNNVINVYCEIFLIIILTLKYNKKSEK